MKLYLLFVLFLVVGIITAQTNSTLGQLVPPSDVSLNNYNTTEFIILLSNVTTNLTQAQAEVVLTSASQLLPSIVIPIRIVIAVFFDGFLFIAMFLLRNYEPLKSKFFISLVLAGINVICHIPASLDLIPFIRIYFQNYWNQFLSERSKNPQLDAQTFYNNNLTPNGVPTWLQNYITFENVYCFVGNYLIYAILIASVSLYAIQVMKLNLLNIIKNMRQTIVKKIEEYKKKQFEKMKNVKLKETSQYSLKESESSRSNLDRSESSTSSSQQMLKGTGFSIDLSSVQSSTSLENSSRPLSARSSKKLMEGDTDSSVLSYDYDDIAMDLTTDEADSYSNTDIDEISKKGKLINFLKRIIKFRIIEIVFVTVCVIAWYIIISLVIAAHLPDKWTSLFYNWDLNSGYCRANDRTVLFICDAALTAAIFFIIPALLVVDLIISLNNYLKIRRNNKEKGESTPNFLTYHFIDSDPYVYRLESFGIIIIDGFSLIAFLILNPFSINQTIYLIGNLFIVLGLNFIGGPATNPGITVLRTMWNYRLAYKARNSCKEKESGAIKTIQQLVSSPISSNSIEKIISHKRERDLFYQFLKEEYSIENLLFIEDLRILRKIGETQVRSKISKIKEMVKLYLSESGSIFEINVPERVISNDLKDYKELLQFFNQEKIKVAQLPRRVAKDSQTRYFPNIDLSKEESVKSLIENLCKPTIFSNLSFEVYKNLMDSISSRYIHYIFINIPSWGEEHIFIL